MTLSAQQRPAANPGTHSDADVLTATVEIFRWQAIHVDAPVNRNALITNSPLLAIGFYGIRALHNAKARNAAAAASIPQWRACGTGSVMLEPNGIRLHGAWGQCSIPFQEIRSWHVDGDAVVIDPVGADPILVRGPGLGRRLGLRLAELTNGRLWRPPATEHWTAASPPAWWCGDHPGFAFGVPSGWHHAAPEYFAFADQEARGGGLQELVALACHDEAATWYIEVAVGPDDGTLRNLDETAGQFARDRATASRGSVTDRPRVVDVAGERATMVSFTVGIPSGAAAPTNEVMVIRSGWVYKISYAAVHPNPTAQLWSTHWPGFQTVIATWQWRH